MMSRILELREIEELRVRRQQRRDGRVRAAPVFVRPGDAAQPDNALESTLSAERSSNPVLNLDASAGARQLGTNGNGHIQENGASRPKPQPLQPTSFSSESSANTETEPVPSTFRLFGKGNCQQKKANKKDTGPPQVDGPQDKGKRKLPRLTLKREHRSFQEPSPGPALSSKERRRCYSFEKGDEILSVTSPTFPAEVHAQLRSPAAGGEAEGSRFRDMIRGLADVPATDEYREPTATPSPDADSGSVRHSTSTDTVRWVGKGEGNGDSGSGSPGERGMDGRG